MMTTCKWIVKYYPLGEMLGQNQDGHEQKEKAQQDFADDNLALALYSRKAGMLEIPELSVALMRLIINQGPDPARPMSRGYYHYSRTSLTPYPGSDLILDPVFQESDRCIFA